MFEIIAIIAFAFSISSIILSIICFNNIIIKNELKEEIPINNEVILNEGARQAWHITQIAMFKMWQELDIIDYDSLFKKLNENLKILTSDNLKFNTWNNKLIEYINQQNEE